MNSWQISRRKLSELTLTILPLGAIRETQAFGFQTAALNVKEIQAIAREIW